MSENWLKEKDWVQYWVCIMYNVYIMYTLSFFFVHAMLNKKADAN